MQQAILSPLLIISCFIFDFSSNHPFTDVNGRMSRLLTLLLLYQNQYLIGKYISFELLIEQTKETYYDVLQESSVGWADNAQDYLPFVQYLLGIILKAYREFEKRFNITHKTKLSSKERVSEIINHALVTLSKVEIVILAPELSQKTIERRLTELVKATEIKKIGSGRSTVYSSIK